VVDPSLSPVLRVLGNSDALGDLIRSTRPAISSEGVRGCGEETLMLGEVYALEADSCTLKHTIPVAACAALLEDMCRMVQMHGQDYRQSSVLEDQVRRAPKREGK
jgi:hypothetical protein